MQKMISLGDINRKLQQYEFFVEETLKKDLKDVETGLTDVVQKYKDWEEVTQVVKTLNEFKEKDRDMIVRVPIAEGLHAQGEVYDFDTTYVNIGLGYLLEMDCQEAEKYAEIRMRSLKRDIEHHRKMACHIKTNIKLVLLAINELQTSMLPGQMETQKLEGQKQV